MMSTPSIQLVECPRDAMQGWPHFIPTSKKIEYINALLRVGFHTIDFGSFVSPKAIPQMADTAEVLKALEPSDTALLAIVANVRGAEEAASHEAIRYLGFPFSISPTFQMRNTNSTPEESMERVKVISEICSKTGKELVIYLSMGFGNPYGDAYSETVLLDWARRMNDLGIKTLSLADTVGLATPAQVTSALQTLLPAYPGVRIGVHLHATATDWQAKFDAATAAGCTRFDGALMGIGGCPMAGNDLVGNMDSALMISRLHSRNYETGIRKEALTQALMLAENIFV